MEDSDFRRSVGRRVHDFRTEHGYTQFQFAELIDISVNFLSEIENGKKGMSQDTIGKLCRTFDLSADYILFGTPHEQTQSIHDTAALIELANSLDAESLKVVTDYLVSLQKIKKLQLK